MRIFISDSSGDQLSMEVLLTDFFMTILNYPVKRSALAKVYRVSPNTFTARLREIEINHTRTLSPADLRKIIEHYELPSGVEIKL